MINWDKLHQLCALTAFGVRERLTSNRKNLQLQQLRLLQSKFDDLRHWITMMESALYSKSALLWFKDIFNAAREMQLQTEEIYFDILNSGSEEVAAVGDLSLIRAVDMNVGCMYEGLFSSWFEEPDSLEIKWFGEKSVCLFYAALFISRLKNSNPKAWWVEWYNKTMEICTRLRV
jgi:hypothetical protein